MAPTSPIETRASRPRRPHHALAGPHAGWLVPARVEPPQRQRRAVVHAKHRRSADQRSAVAGRPEPARGRNRAGDEMSLLQHQIVRPRFRRAYHRRRAQSLRGVPRQRRHTARRKSDRQRRARRRGRLRRGRPPRSARPFSGRGPPAGHRERLERGHDLSRPPGGRAANLYAPRAPLSAAAARAAARRGITSRLGDPAPATRSRARP